MIREKQIHHFEFEAGEEPPSTLGIISAQNVYLTLREDGQWHGEPSSMADYANAFYSPDEYGPQDGEPNAAAVEGFADWLRDYVPEIEATVLSEPSEEGVVY